MYRILIIFFASLLVSGCANEEINPQFPCIKGEVLGKIRSAGGGLAVALEDPIPGAVSWNNRNNVVEVLNIPAELTFSGTTIYFNHRQAKEGERGPISSDGDESLQLVLFGSNFSETGCKENN